MSPEAFERELIAALPELKKRARRFRRAPWDADDLVQDTIATAWRFRDHYEPIGPVLNWLYTMMWRLNASELRKRKRQGLGVQVEDDHMAMLAWAADNQFTATLAHQVVEHINAMHPAEARAVEDCVLGRTVSETAAAAGVTHAAAKGALERGRRALREVFEEAA